MYGVFLFVCLWLFLIFISALLLILKYNKVTNITPSIVALNAGLIYTRSGAFGVRRSFFCQHKHSAETTAMTQLPANAARIDLVPVQI